MWDALSFVFIQRALIGILLCSLACGVLGALVVVNRLTFLAGGIAHFAYGGVGLAMFFSLPLLPTTLGFTLVGALLLAHLTQQQQHRTDTIVGVLWAAGMAFGILLLDLTPGYQSDLISYLFGSILAIPLEDLWWMGAVDLLILLLLAFAYNPLLALSYDPEYAQLTQVPVRWLYPMVLGLLACAIVLLIRLVGIVLVLALLTIPPSLLEHRARSLLHLMLGSAVLCLVFSLLGLIISYEADLTTGACIVGVATLIFAIHYVTDSLRRVRRI